MSNAVQTRHSDPAGEAARYDGLTIALHWLIAGLVVAQFLLAEFWEDAERPVRHVMVYWHMTLGVALGAAMVLRLLWRLTRGRRLPETSVGLMAAAAKAVHLGFYAAIILQAALGFVLRWSGGESMRFFAFAFPPPFAAWSKPMQELVAEAHELTGWAIIGLALIHVAAALYHQVQLKDGLIRRMTPF
jgi:cytochrome b561